MRTPAFALCALLSALPASADTLTAEQVLELRKSGVSDATIRQMLENENQAMKDQQADRVPDDLVEQSYANEHIGSWTTKDGRRVHSTGKGDYPNHAFDPTIPSTQPQYPVNVFPYVGAPVPAPRPGNGPR